MDYQNVKIEIPEWIKKMDELVKSNEKTTENRQYNEFDIEQ